MKDETSAPQQQDQDVRQDDAAPPESRERELKFDVPAAAVRKLKGKLLKLAGCRKQGPPARLISVYFDTEDHALKRAGVSLRTRRKGRARVQTLKIGETAGAGLFDRQEWERPARGAVPVLNLQERAALQVALGDPAPSVAPAFTTTVRRSAYDLLRGDSAIEIAVDEAEVTADGRNTTFCELELELRAGEPASLFALARELSDAAPLRLGVTTKSGRGYELLREKTRRSAKAKGSPIRPGFDVEHGFLAVLGDCMVQFRMNDDLLLGGPNPKAVHQARVALRRLRSAFSMFREAIAGPESRALAAELKWLAGALGGARDLDVMAGRLEQVDCALSLVGRVAGRRDAAYVAAFEALGSRRARDLMLDLVEWSAIGSWRGDPHSADLRAAPIEAFAAAALEKRLKQLKRRGRRIDEISPEQRHEARIAAKKLRYAGEFFEPLYRDGRTAERFEAFAGHLAHLQEELGALNDIATGRTLLRGLADEAAGARDADAAFAAGEAAGRADARTPELLAAAKARMQELKAAKPFWR